MNFTLAESTIAAAFFIIEQENKLIIAQKYLYSNFTNDGFSFEWVVDDEQSNLTFESLGKLLGVKRYLEPQLSQFKELYWEEG
jgi:hypothetical protein